MAGSLRKLCRRFGFDVRRYPGASARWPRLVGMLEAHRVDLVVDVGANTGQYALALLNNGYAGRILSFEPVNATYTDLTHVARVWPRWSVAPRAAVGDQSAEVSVNVSIESDMSSMLPLTGTARQHLSRAQGVATEAVPMVTLADAVPWAEAGRVFVKSDTQGYEQQVLDGLGHAVEHVVGLQLELSLVPIYEGQAYYLRMLEQVEAMGFATHMVIPGYYSRHYGRMLEFDVVCFRGNNAQA